MILTPIVLWFLVLEQFNIGVPLFLFAALTDALDGSLARLRGPITKWGTFYDPIADKVLISAIILFIVIKHINIYFGLFIVFIELLIVGGGYSRKKKGKMTPSANIFGKTKMFLQVLGVTFLLIALWMGQNLFIDFSVGTLSLAIIFAIVSLFTYGL
jgi:cardiolipin synthase